MTHAEEAPLISLDFNHHRLWTPHMVAWLRQKPVTNSGQLAPKVIASERLSNSSPVVGLPDHHLAGVRRFLPGA